MKKGFLFSLKLPLAFLSLISYSSAFSATIKGHISDSKSNEGLIGAVVYLKENNQVNDAAGFDGTFNLKNVQPGTYTLTVEFFGYVKQERSVTVTNATDVVTQDFALAPDSLTLKQVEIIGSYDRESDNYSRNLEKTNDYILNIISAKTMLLLPDVTVGDVLQRVSGVVTQKSVTGGGKYATIRGMDKRYNYTTVNGVKLPSPDYQNKYVPLDLFPSGMLERLEVIKTLRPDMEGDAVGGVMNMVLKSPPDYLVLNAEVSSGYGQSLFNNSFNGINASGINSKSPAQINGPSYYATPSDFPTGPYTYNVAKAAPNADAAFTFGSRYLNNRLGLILSGIYQNTYSLTKSFFLTPDPQPQTSNGPNTPLFDDIENRVYSTQQTRFAAHLKADYDFNRKHKISFFAFYVGMNQYRSDFKTDTIIGTGSGAGTTNQNYETKVTYENIFNATVQGQDSLAHNLQLDWTGSYARGFSNTPDWGTLSTSNSAVGSSIFYYSGWSGRWWQNTDQDITGYINLTYKTSLFGQDVKFKVGAMNRDKGRDDVYDSYSLNPTSNGAKTVYTPTNNSDTLWQIKGAEAQGSPYDANNYSVQEDITGAYGMVNFSIGQKFEVMAGLRGENTSVAYNTPLLINEDAKYGTIQYFDYLPSVEVKYNLTEKQAIRVSYFSSITRPSFEELLPYQIPGDDYTEIGNPYLLHTQAQNYDLRYEFFPSPTEQILAGVFYKNLIDPIEYTLLRYKTSSQYLQPQNDTNSAFCYGFELQVTKYFWQYFGISANYTYTKSQTTVSDKYYYVNSAGSATNEYLNETRPLQGQADNIANLSFIFKNPKMGLDVDLSVVYTGQLIAAASPNYGLDLYQMPQARLDLSFQKTLSKKIKLSIFGKINNILNTPLEIRQYPTSPYSNIGNAAYLPNQSGSGMISNILQEREVYGQYYTLGVRYKL